jgi:hypothetical protein
MVLPSFAVSVNVIRIRSLYAVTEVSKVFMHPSKGEVAQVMPLEFLLVVMKRYIPFDSSSARDLPTENWRRTYLEQQEASHKRLSPVPDDESLYSVIVTMT